MADVGAFWRQNSLEKLHELIAAQIEGGEHEGLAERLSRLLRTSDVVLEVKNVQRLQDTLPGFVRAFWQPLQASLSSRHTHRLVVLTRLERPMPDPLPRAWGDVLQDDPDKFDPCLALNSSADALHPDGTD